MAVPEIDAQLLEAFLDAFNAHDGKLRRKDSFWKIVE